VSLPEASLLRPPLKMDQVPILMLLLNVHVIIVIKNLLLGWRYSSSGRASAGQVAKP
jgi:hypothetical protein